MARTTKTIITCDLHDGDDFTQDVEEISFSLDGQAYEVDACAEHAAELREDFARYVGAARKAERGQGSGGGGRRASRGQSRPAASSGGGADREEIQAIREWARENGHKVNARGRLSAAVLEAYRAAH